MFAALVGLILGIVGNYVFEGFGLRTRAAKLSRRRAKKRLRRLRRELETLRHLHSDPARLAGFVASRVLLVTILWIGQEVLDYLLGLLANATYTYALTSRPGAFDVERFTSGVNTAASGIGALLLVLILNLGFRAYRTWKRVSRFETYEAKLTAEMAELRGVVTDRGGNGAAGESGSGDQRSHDVSMPCD